ncbi:winged helix-turn-helix transcriptional regulator [Natronorubrum sp. JWXQ-INN-674]|uniref:Winged helix-turn-helix transcriptional regulator n=1 Tax=Natronorubrum halalkaliphilum TaxID=2691917 RepID=A0A6B0VK29_9EURY|nr:winged helix-turn-helix transcriptional regulator [Natronorubrum halalkaliphilum]MXV61910.1 winged helix-turn-helix transcriptional regulator [Natronorubrum halalkaliphilum]
MEHPSETLSDLPPSAKLVYKVLEHNTSLNQQELAEETMLPKRTVRFALTRLKESGLVEERISFRDARQSVYSLTEDGKQVHAPPVEN